MTSLWAGFLLAALASAQSGPDKAPRPSREDVEKRIRADAAERTKASEADVRVIEFEERTWPDSSLGCAVRKGLVEPAPVPGYQVVVAVGESRFEYHADKAGRFVRCDSPKKPLGPISR